MTDAPTLRHGNSAGLSGKPPPTFEHASEPPGHTKQVVAVDLASPMTDPCRNGLYQEAMRAANAIARPGLPLVARHVRRHRRYGA